ncbi:MAG: tetratricopeptide repeat protein, partial [Candidatus Latescibacterota bacterium]|nr:tetratricopeptide repeat protein [Candidatus Latescibacterota bacterium]
GEMAEAGQRYEDAIALEHPTSTLNRGLLHIRQRHYREALPLLDQVIRKSGGEHPRASSARSVARYFTGELYEAVEDLRKARRLGGATAALDNNLGCLNLALGDLRQARSFFEQALAKDPQQTAANHNLGKLLVIVGQPGPAVAHLQRAADRRPDDKVLAANLREARRLASR